MKKDKVQPMKKFLLSLPEDVKQTLSSLAVALALICGSLFVLSAYFGTVTENESVEVVAPPPVEESAESSAQ
jgi:hypothetical protein